MSVTSEQYVNGLPVNALEQTEECLQQDLETLRENGLPVADTVAALCMVHARREGQEASSCDV